MSQPVDPSRMEWEALRSVLDLDTWDIFDGITSTSGCICPHCKRRVFGVIRETPGPMVCPWCKGDYYWTAAMTPLGYAWQSWRLVRKGTIAT